MLEALAHQTASFVTLTYSDDCLPASNSLSGEDWRKFTKGIGYRYFGCGEYGEKTGRPHYHVVLFGLSPSAAEAFCAARWSRGFVSVRPFAVEHAAYVAAYTVKKLTKEDDERLAEGQAPEFARMSRRPGIGVPGLRVFERFWRGRGGAEYVRRERDVGRTLRIAGSFYPVGRLLLDELRRYAGVQKDDPVRNAIRDERFRARQMSPEAVKAREAKRVCQYEHARARAARARGVL